MVLDMGVITSMDISNHFLCACIHNNFYKGVEQVMREILFRGKTIKDNKWVYGYYASDKDGHYILVNYDNGIKQHTVYENSVGQWTGKYDKNGIKMFEGDIVEIESYGFYRTDYSPMLATFLFFDINDSSKRYLSEFLPTKTKVIDNIFDERYREQTINTDNIEDKVEKIRQIENALNIKFTTEQIKFLLFGTSNKDMKYWDRGTGKTFCSFVKSIMEIPKDKYIYYDYHKDKFYCYHNNYIYDKISDLCECNFCKYDKDVDLYNTYSITRRSMNKIFVNWLKECSKHDIVQFGYKILL